MSDSGELKHQGEVTGNGGVRVYLGTATLLPYECDLFIDQGATFKLNVSIYDQAKDPLQLAASNYTAAFVARVASGETAVIDLDEADGITLGDSDANCVVTIASADVAALDFVQARYLLTVTSSGGQAWAVMAGFLRLRKTAAA